MKTDTFDLIRPASFRLDGGAMYGIIPKPLWEKKSPPDELNRIDLALRLMLIRTEEKNILIDTGIGDYRPEKWNKRFDVRGQAEPLRKVLEEKFNLKAEQITDVILSHLHFDHVGGLGSDPEAVLFPNATLHLHSEHYRYALNPTPRDAGSFETKSIKNWIETYQKLDKINWLSGHQGEVMAGINFLTSHGHTPWMIHPYSDQWIYMADLVPTSHHIAIPWVMGYDINPGQTAREKGDILNFILEKDLICVFEHDPEFWGARIQKGPKGFEVKKTYSCPGNSL